MTNSNYVQLSFGQFRLIPSPAASVSASGETQFKFLTGLMEGIAGLGLDPGQVHQGVLFFAARRHL